MTAESCLVAANVDLGTHSTGFAWVVLREIGDSGIKPESAVLIGGAHLAYDPRTRWRRSR